MPDDLVIQDCERMTVIVICYATGLEVFAFSLRRLRRRYESENPADQGGLANSEQPYKQAPPSGILAPVFLRLCRSLYAREATRRGRSPASLRTVANMRLYSSARS